MRRHARDAGMVTAEIAVALTALMTLLAAMVWVIAVVGMQLRCVDAARDGARALARGETARVSRAEAERTAPEGARVRFGAEGDLVNATVSVDARPDWPVLAALPSVRVDGRAAVAVEPGEIGTEEPGPEQLDQGQASPEQVGPEQATRGRRGPSSAGGEERREPAGPEENGGGR